MLDTVMFTLPAMLSSSQREAHPLDHEGAVQAQGEGIADLVEQHQQHESPGALLAEQRAQRMPYGVGQGARRLPGYFAAPAPRASRKWSPPSGRPPAEMPVASRGARRSTPAPRPPASPPCGSRMTGAAAASPRSLTGIVSTRYASITMSWEAERNATSTARAPSTYSSLVGEQKPMTAMATARADLINQDPAAATAQHRRQIPVEQRRPQELEEVGQTDQRKDADGLDVEALGCEPRLHGEPGQIERQPGGEAHQEDRHHALVAQRLQKRGLRGRGQIARTRIQHGAR